MGLRRRVSCDALSSRRMDWGVGRRILAGPRRRPGLVRPKLLATERDERRRWVGSTAAGQSIAIALFASRQNNIVLSVNIIPPAPYHRSGAAPGFQQGSVHSMIVGIDLGTTNSLVGVWRDGAASLIPNSLGPLLTPSAGGVGRSG